MLKFDKVISEGRQELQNWELSLILAINKNLHFKMKFLQYGNEIYLIF